MGNSIPLLSTEPLDARSCIQKLPGSKIVQEEVLCDRRFMKSFRSKRDNESLVVKVYYTGDADEGDLDEAESILLEQRDKFSKNSNAFNVIPYQSYIELDDISAAFLIRQYFHNNLQDALLHHHPPLTFTQKLFVVYQMLQGLKQMHRSGECHGDLKMENIMLTSWNWVFLTDMAAFKPTNLPINDPSFFSYFFENSRRLSCCIAPERFTKSLSYLESLVEAEENLPDGQQQGPSVLDLKPAMDIFSLGCVIAEIFAVDHRPLFSHPTLLQYIANEYDPAEAISKLECPQSIKNLVAHMIQKSPTSRFTLNRYISLCGAGASRRHKDDPAAQADDFCMFPFYFPFLFDFLKATVSDTLGCNDADARVRLIAANYASILENVVVLKDQAGNNELPSAASVAESKVETDASTDSGRPGIVVDKAGEALFDHLLRTSEDEKSGIFRKAEQRRGNRSKSHGSASPSGSALKAVSVDHKDQGAVLEPSLGSPSASSAASPRSPGGDSMEDLLAEIEALEQDAEVALAKKVANVKFKKDASDDSTQNDYVAQFQSIGMGLGSAARSEGNPGSSVVAQIAELHGSQLMPASSNDAFAALDVVEKKAALQQQRQQYLDALQCEGDHDVLTCGSTAAKRYPLPVAAEGLVIVLDVVLTSLRNVRLPANQIIALNLMVHFARFCEDGIRLQKLIPYIIELLKDSSQTATVRAAALHALATLLTMTRSLPKRDQSIFEDYIFPALSTYATDREPLVQLAFATCLSQIASVAKRFLDKSFASQLNEPTSTGSASASSAAAAEGVGDTLGDSLNAAAAAATSRLNYFQQLENLHDGVKKMIQPLVAQQTPHSSLIKRSLLSTIIKLCVFFGRKETENFLLPLLFTFLNDTDWQLRAALFDHIAGVLAFAPWTSRSHKQILLVMLTDCEELVVARVLGCIRTLCTLKMPLYDRHLLLGFAAGAAPILLHPSPLLRQRVCEVIIAVADLLCPTDVHVLLLPRLVPYIRIDQLQGHHKITVELLQVVAFSPISRSAYNKALRLTLKAPGQKAGFRWRTGDGERMEMHFWLRAARNTGLLPPDDCHDDEVPAQLKDSESGPSIPPAHIQTTMAEAAYALPDSHFDAERQRRSGPPPPPPPLRDTMDASRLDTAVRESVAEEEASFVKSREKKEASSLPSEAKKLQWLQPYIKGVSNSIKKFSVASKPLQEIAQFDYAAYVDRMAQGPQPGAFSRYNQMGSGGLSRMGAASIYGGGVSKLPGSQHTAQGNQSGATPTGSGGVVRRQIYVASQFFLPQNLKSKSQVSQKAISKRDILEQLKGATTTPHINGGSSGASSETRPYTIALPRKIRSSRAEDETYNEIRRNFNLRVQQVSTFPGVSDSAIGSASGSKYRRQQVLLDTHTLLQRIKALDIPSLPQDLGGLTLDTMKEFSKYELMCDVCKEPVSLRNGDGNGGSDAANGDANGGGASATSNNGNGSAGAAADNGLQQVNLIVPGKNDVALGLGMRVWGMQRMAHLVDLGDMEELGLVASAGAEGLRELDYWVPRGILVHQSTEHLGAVRFVEVAEDESFFATGADDGTVKIWLASRLGDRSIMMSARTIHCGGAAGSANSSASAHPPAVTALKCCDNSRSIAVGNKAGELSLFRVELLMSGGKSSATPDAADQMDSGSINYPDAGGASGDGQPDDDSSSTPRSSSSSIRAPSDPNMAATATTLNSMHARAMQRKSRIVCHAPLLQDLHSASSSRGSDLAHGAIVAIEHLSTQISSLLVYATHNVGLHAWDMRQRRAPWAIPVAPELGRITDIAMGGDGQWLVAGTSNGFLMVYDLRYQLLLKLWSVVPLVRSYDMDASICINSVKCTPELNLFTNQFVPQPQTTRDFTYASSYHAWENQPIVTVAVGANTLFVVDVSTGMLRHTFLSTHMDADHEDFPDVEFLEEIPIPTARERRRQGSLLPLSYIQRHVVRAENVRHRTSVAHAHLPQVRTFFTPSRCIADPSGHRGMPAAFMFTGGDDRAIRFWNLRRGVQHSLTFSGHGHRDRESSIYGRKEQLSCCFEALDNPSNRLFSSSPSHGDKSPGASSRKKRASSASSADDAFDSASIADNIGVAEGSDLTLDDSGRFRGPKVASGLHEDSILALNMLEPQRLLISSSRDGVVKVWR